MTLYNEIRPAFQKHGAEIFGISADGVWCHQAFARHNRVHFPLPADFEPKGRGRETICAYARATAYASAPSSSSTGPG
jgi:peroxiredoxin